MDAVFSILEPRVKPVLLKGFRSGLLDSAGTRLMAYTLLPAADEDFMLLFDLYLENERSDSFPASDEAKYMVQTPGGGYTYKGTRRLVEEGIYQYVLLIFYGVLFNGEWQIRYDIRFAEGGDAEALSQQQSAELERLMASGLCHYFGNVSAEESSIDYHQLNTLFSGNSHDPAELLREARKLLGQNLPMIHRKQDAQYREYAGLPWLAALNLQEEKHRINRAFNAWFNEAVFLPFLHKLRISRTEEFYEPATLYHRDHFPLIYPQSKDQLLIIVKLINRAGESRLCYFCYLPGEKKFYRWTRPRPRSAPGHHLPHIHEHLAPLSAMGADFDLHEPSVTLDDNEFWQKHVLARDQGKYKYLDPIAL